MSEGRNTALFAAALALTTAAVTYDHVAWGVPEPAPAASSAPVARGASPCSAGTPVQSPCAAGAPLKAAPPPPAPMPQAKEGKLPPPPPPAPKPTAEAPRAAPPPPPARLPEGASEAPDLVPDRDS